MKIDSRVKMPLWLIIPLAVLVFVGCTGDGPSGDGSPSDTPSPGVPSPSAVVCPTEDGEVVEALVARLDVEKAQFQPGEPVELTLRVVNCASAPITRSFPDAQRFEFTATGPDGLEVWRWSDDKTFEEVLGEQTFQPRQEQTYTESWDQTDSGGQPVAAGEYQLRGESTSCDEPLVNCGPASAKVIEVLSP